MTGRRSPVKDPKDCHERALGLLAVRPRSRRELETRLRAAGFDHDEVQAVLERLERVGLVDDRAFAEQLAAHHFTNRKSGSRAVASALAAKGVSPAISAAVLAAPRDDERGRARELARAKASRMAGVDGRKAFTRLTGLLMRRGYDPETAREAAREALDLEAAADET